MESPSVISFETELEEGSAKRPIMVLLLPLVKVYPADFPINVLQAAEVILLPALSPTAVFWKPLVRLNSDSVPTPVLKFPVLLYNVLYPRATLLEEPLPWLIARLPIATFFVPVVLAFKDSKPTAVLEAPVVLEQSEKYYRK